MNKYEKFQFFIEKIIFDQLFTWRRLFDFQLQINIQIHLNSKKIDIYIYIQKTYFLYRRVNFSKFSARTIWRVERM